MLRFSLLVVGALGLAAIGKRLQTVGNRGARTS